jgi:hypothetical protein
VNVKLAPAIHRNVFSAEDFELLNSTKLSASDSQHSQRSSPSIGREKDSRTASSSRKKDKKQKKKLKEKDTTPETTTTADRKQEAKRMLKRNKSIRVTIGAKKAAVI